MKQELQTIRCFYWKGRRFFDSKGGATNHECNKDKPPTLADVLDEVRALRKEVALVKFDDARISKLERILNDNFMFRNDISPNGNHNAINQGLSGSANHPMSTCSRPDIDNAEVAGHVIGIHKADGKNDSPNGNQNGVKKGLSCSANDPLSTCSGADILDGEVAGALIGIHKADGKNDSPNVNHNAVNKGLSGSANDPMSTCSSPDMDNGEVSVAGMGIHKADGQNDIPNANDNAVNQGIIGSANDPMPSTLDVLVQGFDSQNNHPGIDVLQHDIHVDCYVAKLNDHPTTDIGVKVVPVDEFADDYMDVLNAEESILNYSLDYMKLQVDELIDVHEDKITVLQENVKDVSNKSQYVNVVKEDYKPYLGMFLPMSKQRGRSVDVFGEPKMKSINELMTLEVFVEQLSRPHNCIRDKVTLPDGLSDFINMQDPQEYRFSWGYRDIIVDREFWYPVAWQDVEKVYFPVNEPKKHWCLAELHISTGVITFYDSLGWVCGNRRPWWRTMKRTLPQQLTLYLNEHGVLQSKGIAVETYEIKYMFSKVVRQADDYRDCGIWVCIFLYRLSCNLPLTVDDPLQTTLAYRERMLEYFWRHKIQADKTVVLDEGTYQLIILPVKSLLQFRTVSKSWKSCIDSSAFFFKYGVHDNLFHTPTLTNLYIVNLKQIGTSHGVWCFSYANNMMVSIANPSIKKEVGVFVPNSQPDSCKILLGFGVRPDNLDPTVFSIDGGSITSAPAIMTMPSNHFIKLLGFNNHDLPIVEAATGHIMGHTIQVYMGTSQSFENVVIQGNAGFWSGGLMCYVDLVKVFSHGL
ncbi:phospholipase-like protein [Tanacetum coccineum]